MSALGPMAGPPPDALPIPPQLMGPGGPPDGPGGPDQGPPGLGGGGGEESDEETLYKQIADDLHHALSVEKDPQDQVILTKMLGLVAQLRASRDKERQDAMGMSPALKLAARTNR